MVRHFQEPADVYELQIGLAQSAVAVCSRHADVVIDPEGDVAVAAAAGVLEVVVIAQSYWRLAGNGGRGGVIRVALPCPGHLHCRAVLHVPVGGGCG